MRIAGAGEAGSRGGENGDLYVFVSIKSHKLYTREGANLYTRVPISMCCAALGGKVEIPSIDGEKIELDIAAGSQSDQVVKVKKSGNDHDAFVPPRRFVRQTAGRNSG